MRVEYLSSYDRSFQKLPTSIQHRTISTIDVLLDYFSTGQRSHGLGLKRLRRAYWEIRIGLGVRVLFELQQDRLTFILVGDHEAIRRWLKTS